MAKTTQKENWRLFQCEIEWSTKHSPQRLISTLNAIDDCIAQLIEHKHEIEQVIRAGKAKKAGE